MGVRSTAGKALAVATAGALGAMVAAKVQYGRSVDEIWGTLENSGGKGEPFREEMVSDLPDPARRYFLHAIRPGTPLASTLHWGYSASMRPGKQMPWMDLVAEQILVKERGFVWKATATRGVLVVTGTDYYLDGEGRMRIALFGLIPVVNASGPDLSRSAQARLLIEGVALPSAFLPGPEGSNRWGGRVQLHRNREPARREHSHHPDRRRRGQAEEGCHATMGQCDRGRFIPLHPLWRAD